MSWINSSIAVLMPYVPKWFARPFAKPYVAGESIESVTEIVRSINRNGFSTTLDILGEHIHTPSEANKILDNSVKLDPQNFDARSLRILYNANVPSILSNHDELNEDILLFNSMIGLPQNYTLYNEWMISIINEILSESKL